jgi:hypothetical protein
LPRQIHDRFEARAGNKQSQLLQEIKDVIRATYSRTEMRGDGQVVLVPFDTTAVEVAPGFRFTDGTIRVCDTNNGGRYIVSTAEAERLSIEQSDLICNGDTHALARMLKHWRVEQNVPLKSFQLERLAVDFLAQYEPCARDIFFYDWMVRDFFGSRASQIRARCTKAIQGDAPPVHCTTVAEMMGIFKDTCVGL